MIFPKKNCDLWTISEKVAEELVHMLILELNLKVNCCSVAARKSFIYLSMFFVCSFFVTLYLVFLVCSVCLWWTCCRLVAKFQRLTVCIGWKSFIQENLVIWVYATYCLRKLVIQSTQDCMAGNLRSQLFNVTSSQIVMFCRYGCHTAIIICNCSFKSTKRIYLDIGGKTYYGS